MSCVNNQSNINETFIIEPIFVGTDIISACTAVYTNELLSCSGNTKIFMGSGVITFDGNLYTNDSLTANTINASTYYSGGTNLLDIFSTSGVQLTGGSFNDITKTLSLYNSNGSVINVTGFTDYYTTGATLIGKTVYFDRNNALSAYTLDLSSFSNEDIYTTGLTFSNNQIIIARNDGVNLNTFVNYFSALTIGNLVSNTISANTISATTYLNLPIDPDTYVTGFTFDQLTYLLKLDQNTNGQFSSFTANLAILASDVTITGGTYNSSTGVATFTNNSGGTFNVTGFTTGLTDTIITNFTYSPTNNTFTITQSNGSAFTATFTSVSGLTVNNSLFVSGATNPVRFVGLSSSANTRYLVSDINGILTYRTDVTTGNTLYNGNGSLSGNRIVDIDGFTLAFSSATFPNSLTLYNGKTGVNISNPSNQLHVYATENPLRLDNVQYSDDYDTLTIDASGVVHKKFELDRVVLRKVDLGSRTLNDVRQVTEIATNLKKILNNREIYDIINLQASMYYYCKIDYFYTINNDKFRSKYLWATQVFGKNFDSTTAFNEMLAYIGGNYSTPNVINFYCEVYLETDSRYSAPTQIKLVNPLFNSLNPNKYSMTNAYLGVQEFVRSLGSNYVTPPKNSDPNVITSNLLSGFQAYYDRTDNDIRKKISEIVTESLFYGPISGESNQVINFDTFNVIKDSIINSVYIEPLKNFYSKFRIPVNLHGFYMLNRYRYNNFYGNLMYDIIGGSDPNVVSYSTSQTQSSKAFCHFIDTYRLCPSGTSAVVYYNNGVKDTKLNQLSYEMVSTPKYKYMTEKNNRNMGSYMQVLPYYNDIYVVKLGVTGTPDGQSFLTSLLNDYGIINDVSLIGNEYWDRIIQDAAQYLVDESTFKSNPYGPYVLIQSNDIKMGELSGATFDYGVGSVNILAIYKGYTFRPSIFPLNLSQLILEVPATYYFSKDSFFEYNNISFNKVAFGSPNTIDKQLRMIINYKKINKFDVVTLPLIFTTKRSQYDNSIFTMSLDDTVYQNLETALNANISRSKIKYLRPNDVEILLALFDVNNRTTSIISDYKVIIKKYGDNEIFKLIRVA